MTTAPRSLRQMIAARRTTRDTAQAELARAVRPVTESLEARRLLSTTLNTATGILTVQTDSANDIVQFETQGNAAGVTGFRVIESEAGAPLGGTSQDDYNDYIEAGTNVQTSQFFDVAEVRRIIVRTELGNDLVIAGRTLPVPIDVDAGGGNDSISGGPRADTLLGNAGDDYVFGGGADDLVTGGTGSDVLIGGDGFDRTDYRTRSEPVSVTLNNNSDDGEAGEGDNVSSDIEGIVGGLGNDVLSASGRNNAVSLAGGPGNDTLTGGSGNDTLDGNEGEDSLAGNAGSDLILAFDNEDDNINTSGDGTSVDTVYADPAGPRDDINESLTSDNVTQDEADVLLLDRIAETFDEAPALVPGFGGTSFDAATGILTVNGTADDDRIEIGSTDADQIIVSRRDLDAASGDDSEGGGIFEASLISEIRVYGLDGEDRIFVGGTGITTIVDAGAGDDTLISSDGDDILAGNFGDDLIFGGDGDDTINGGYGADTLRGGLGTDQVTYSDRDRPVTVGLGVLADDGEPGELDDVLTDVEIVVGGSAGDNFSTTSGLPVRFFGGGGNDTLTGGSGNDYFAGGPGRDAMSGQGGNDEFFAQDGEADTLVGGSGTDSGTIDAGVDVLDSIENT